MTQAYPPPAGYGFVQQRSPHQPRNGFGITALVVGLIAICLGLIPLFGLGAIIGGIVAVTFGSLGIGRARRGVASNKKMSVTGVIAGVLAGALGVWGLVIVGNAFNELSSTINGARPSIGVPAGAPAAPGGTSAADPESTTGAFGQSITWPDGVAVTVLAPEGISDEHKRSNKPGGGSITSACQLL